MVLIYYLGYYHWMFIGELSTMRSIKLLKTFNIITHILRKNPKDFFNKRDEILEITKEGFIIWQDFAKAKYITYLDKENQLMTKNLSSAQINRRSY